MMNVSIDSTKINVGLKRIDDLLAEPEIKLIGEGKKLDKYDIGFEDVTVVLNPDNSANVTVKLDKALGWRKDYRYSIIDAFL